MCRVVVSHHATLRWWERHGKVKGWGALSSPEELAQQAWDEGQLRWIDRNMRVVKDYKECRFVFSPDGDPVRTLITFFSMERR